MPVHQQRAVSRTFAYLGWTLGVCAAVAAAIALDAVHEVTGPWFLTSFAIALLAILAIVMGRDTFRLRTLRILLTVFAAAEGVFFGHIAEIHSLPLLAAAIGVAALLFVAMALWGLVSGHQFVSLTGFLFWSLLAMVASSIVAVLFGAGLILLLLSVAGILLFALYTAHDIAWVVLEASEAADAEAVERIAIEGAVALYLDFANLVVDFLRLLAEFIPFDLGG